VLCETKGEMMNIKRYDIYPDMIINEEVGSEMQCISEISQDGDYCLYSDIEPLIAENKRLVSVKDKPIVKKLNNECFELLIDTPFIGYIQLKKGFDIGVFSVDDAGDLTYQCGDHVGWSVYDITHWMPLPELPKD
jgi:hypothetical protein